MRKLILTIMLFMFYTLNANETKANIKELTTICNNKIFKKDKQHLNLEPPCATLGILYYQGKGVKKNIDKALFFLKKGANKNELYSQVALATIYKEKRKNCKMATKYANMVIKNKFAMYEYKMLKVSINILEGCLPKNLQKKRKSALKHIEKGDESFLKKVDDNFKKDKLFILQAVMKNGFALEYVDKRFKKDKEVVLVAVNDVGSALKYADNSLKKDKEVVLVAVNGDGSALEYVDKRFKKDKEVVLAAIKQNPLMFEYADNSLKKDKEVVLAVVKENGAMLKYADDSLKKDKEVVLAAVNDVGSALKYADKSLRTNKDFIRSVVEIDYHNLAYVDHTLQIDKKFIMSIIKNNYHALKYADLNKDKKFILSLLKETRLGFLIMNNVDDSLKHDKDLWNATK